MKINKQKTLFIFTTLAVILIPVFVFADYGSRATAEAAGLQTGFSLPVLVGNIIGTALSMIAVLFFIFMVYGGFLWMTARGNEETSKQAKNTIISAIIGIIVVLSSYALTTFVFESVSGGGDSSGLLQCTDETDCAIYPESDCESYECCSFDPVDEVCFRLPN